METWYMTGGYDGRIEEVKVVKRTAKFITVLKTDSNGKPYESRQMIRTGYENYWPTLEEAKGHLLDTHERAVKYAEDRLSDAVSELAKVRKRIAHGDILKA